MTHTLRSVVIAIALLVCSVSATSTTSAPQTAGTPPHEAVETVTWLKTPIPVQLVVGVEQMLRLPANADVGLPPPLANPDVFRTLVTGGTAYWTALEPFATQRIQVRLESGEFLLFDVSARTEKAPPAQVPTLQVVMPGDGENGDVGLQGLHTAGLAGPRGQGTARGESGLFALVRFAAQSIYAPQRLIAPLPGVREIPVGLSGNYSRLYDHGRQPLAILPHRAWSAGGLYVTAFIVTNQARTPVVLDNRRVQHTPHALRTGVDPHFIASVFFTTQLSARDSDQAGKARDSDETVSVEKTGDDRTTLFIVTDRPIRGVIRGMGV
ncbi:MAG: hypothetical protein CME59_16425 [Halioglobus sp.]|nr:hypothetical protein [Halioglobus sp.]